MKVNKKMNGLKTRNMEVNVATYVLVFGLILIISTFMNYGLRTVGIPALTGYFVLGVILHLINERLLILEGPGIAILEFLANIGIVAMLLKIGLESKISELIKFLPKATVIWVGDILISGVFGFLSVYFLLDWGLIPSLFAATAFTATSVGISTSIWDEMHAIDTEAGQTLLDVAEMDDISGILLMGILFSVVPVLQEGAAESLAPGILSAVGLFVIKLVVFGFICIFLSRYVAEELIEILNRMHGRKGDIVVVVGLGLFVAAISGLLGFSFAIGAFFVGIILSGNRTKIKVDASFDAIYALFVPFFFIAIGFTIDLSGTTIIWSSLLIFMAAAFLGKFLGAGLGTWTSMGFEYAGIIGLSMIPRAEIFLIIMQRGYELGAWAVTSEIFTYSVILSAVSAIIVPILLRVNLKNKQGQLIKLQSL